MMIDKRLAEAVKRGFLLAHGKEEDLRLTWKWYCDEHHIPFITVYETSRGRARVRCILPSPMEITPTVKPLIAIIGQSIGLIDNETAKTLSDVKRSYDAGGSVLNTCSTIPTANAIAFVTDIVNLIRVQPDVFKAYSREV